MIKKFVLGLLALMGLTFGALPATAATLGNDIVAESAALSGVVDLGHASPSDPIEIALTLNYRRADELERLVEAQSTPDSPQFRHFLSNEQFNAYFAPTAADYARVIATLQQNGFRITQTYPNATVVDAVGTVDAANRLFATDIHRVNQPGQGLAYSNALPAHAPAALRGLIQGISGLDTVIRIRPGRQTARSTAQALAPDVATPLGDVAPDAAGQPLYGPAGKNGSRGYGPLAFSQGYLFPNQFKSAAGKYYDGRGRRSGVVMSADFLDTDLATFLHYFGVTRTGPNTVRILVNGGPRRGLSPGSEETTLDVEALVSNAPGTALYVYEMPSLSYKNIIDAYNRVVANNIVDIANSSFGGCEQASTAQTMSSIALQGASKGITFHASTGDTSTNVCGNGRATVSMPADSPYFAAIGGTALHVNGNGSYNRESVWHSSAAGTGSGISSVFATPAWQARIAGAYLGGRNLPDVSLDADPATGMAVYIGGTWKSNFNPIGGTSLASPLFGAAVTELDQVVSGRAGAIAITLYNIVAKYGYGHGGLTYFHDITSGCNIGPTPGYCARRGFDQVSGIGSVAWMNLLI